MAIKICVDAGHYKGYNPSSVFKGYYEGNMTWLWQKHIVKALEAYGFDVITTRNAIEKDLSLSKRGSLAIGCDLFLSGHSNACGTESVDRAVIIRGTSSNNALANELGACITNVMDLKSKHQVMIRVQSNGDEYYGVLRSAKNVGCANRYIIEHSFHTNTRATKWLSVDENIRRVATEEAYVIAKFYGLDKPKPEVPPTSSTSDFKVRVTVSGLNIRSGAGTSYKVVGTIRDKGTYTITKTNGSWGYLKSGAGWINIDKAYVTRL